MTFRKMQMALTEGTVYFRT